MLQKIGFFLRPSGAKFFVFAALILLMPVVYITSEPQRTNYRIGEKRHRLIKIKYYGSPLDGYLFHTEGGFNIFMGIIERNYFSNYIGIILLVFYYTIACGVSTLVTS